MKHTEKILFSFIVLAFYQPLFGQHIAKVQMQRNEHGLMIQESQEKQLAAFIERVIDVYQVDRGIIIDDVHRKNLVGIIFSLGKDYQEKLQHTVKRLMC